jgi:hypothetical protein
VEAQTPRQAGNSGRQRAEDEDGLSQLGLAQKPDRYARKPPGIGNVPPNQIHILSILAPCFP